ncbi:hypothetical protein [Nonomuraea soli]|uniref:DUF4386 family protein n=1 Tax=Nonomuraea soli TaxID=1032476 RepID=A0A7W0CSE8_9ACTN|nr:hypothetical protein [Nonomuraea soli]MBA2896358.1 hypothetical protein [Nonomuraea soli]
MTTSPVTRAALAASGLLFLAYPLVRPYSDETTLEGAQAMASGAWIASHLFAVAGFVLLSLALLGVYRSSGDDRLMRAAAVTWIGAGLTLPYYGAEVFGLHVIAARAAREQDASLLTLADDFRFHPAAVTMFAAGLILLGVGAVLAALALGPHAWPLAVGMALFLPQFFTPPAVRIAHGALLAAGAIWLTARLDHRAKRPVNV